MSRMRRFPAATLLLLLGAVLLIGSPRADARNDASDPGPARVRAGLRPLAQVHGVAFAPDGRTVRLHTEQGGLRLIDRATGRDVGKATWPKAGPERAALSSDGMLVAHMPEDGMVAVSETQTGRIRSRRPFPGSPIVAFAFSPDGAHVAGGTDVGNVELFRLADGLASRSVRDAHNAPVAMLRHAWEGSLVAAYQDGLIRRWNSRGRRVRDYVVRGRGTARIALARDVPRMLTARSGGPLQLWDLSRGRVLRTLDSSGRAFDLALSADGSLAAALIRTPTGAGRGKLVLWDTETGEALESPSVGEPDAPGEIAYQHMAMAPDGLTVAVVDKLSKVYLFELEGPPQVRTTTEWGAALAMAGFASDGQRMVVRVAEDGGRASGTSDWARRSHTSSSARPYRPGPSVDRAVGSPWRGAVVALGSTTW